MDGYREFLQSKVLAAEQSGFTPIAEDRLERLFPFQWSIVDWALRRGRTALFAECGLGKSGMALAWANAVRRHTGRPVLILTPLAVAPQFVTEATKFGVDAVVHCQSQSDVISSSIAVTNYQKLHHFDASSFAGVVADESSILKSYTGKIKQQLIESFRDTPYKLCCTATPAPNDHMELGNHAEFLGVMPSTEMLMRWFINDAGHAGKYRLKHHAEADFWRWVSSWAVCMSKPSDLGFNDKGFDLPPLQFRDVVVTSKQESSNGQLFDPSKVTATSIHREMRKTADARAKAVADLIDADKSAEPWVVWCNTDYEADALKPVLPLALEVRGSHTDAKKEAGLNAFTAGDVRVIISKPSIAGFGLNWQHCHKVAFVGLSYSYEQMHQAIRRCYRFGQSNPVDCYVISADSEGDVIRAVREKEQAHKVMVEKMTASVRHNFGSDQSARKLRMEFDMDQAQGERWKLYNGDCVEALRDVESDTVGMVIYSPPFGNLYTYSDSYRDMGNVSGDEEFIKHYEFLVPELLRITVPGRLCVVHCKDLPAYRNRDGNCGLRDFPGDLIRCHERHGWAFHSRVTVWKCPVVERERTNNNGLLHKTVKRDSSQLRQGMADYVLVFRKPPGEESNLSQLPIERPEGFTEYVGTSDPRTDKSHPSRYARTGFQPGKDDSSVAIWRRYAEPVWWDIDQTDVLNYELARDGADEKHICPLQIGLIERCVELWSLPNDLVCSPFTGIGSEGYQSLLMGRRFVGAELKQRYFEVACANLERAEKSKQQKSLFDQLENVSAN